MEGEKEPRADRSFSFVLLEVVFAFQPVKFTTKDMLALDEPLPAREDAIMVDGESFLEVFSSTPLTRRVSFLPPSQASPSSETVSSALNLKLLPTSASGKLISVVSQGTPLQPCSRLSPSAERRSLSTSRTRGTLLLPVSSWLWILIVSSPL